MHHRSSLSQMLSSPSAHVGSIAVRGLLSIGSWIQGRNETGAPPRGRMSPGKGIF
jgi:hypothetical protein